MNIKELARKVAEHFRPPFFYDASAYKDDDTIAVIRNSERDGQFGIVLRHDDYTKKIIISGEWPRAADGTLYPLTHERTDVTIRVSDTRKSTDVAKEITRRMYPEYIIAFGKGVMQRDEHNAYMSRRDTTLEEFAKLLKGEVRNETIIGGPFISEERGYIHNLMVGDNTVQFELRSLPIHVAKRVLATWLEGWEGDCPKCHKPLKGGICVACESRKKGRE